MREEPSVIAGHMLKPIHMCKMNELAREVLSGLHQVKDLPMMLHKCAGRFEQ
jgi:hypothetical protein